MSYDLLRKGLSAPICLTWELTYACNLRCVHCLSTSGQPRPGELTTEECRALLDEWAEMQVFHINVGGGEPLLRPDFFEIAEYAVARRIGFNFSSNGTLISREIARWLAGLDYSDVQISLDGATAEINDAIRGHGTYERARRAMEYLSEAGINFKISTVVTRRSFPQIEDLYRLANSYGAALRLARLRPCGRGQRSWEDLHLTHDQHVALYRWLHAHPDVLTGDSFFHLSALGKPLPGLNMCGAGSLVCGVDPVGDVYACPFAPCQEFRAGNIRERSFRDIWRDAPLFLHLRGWEVQGCRSCPAFDVCHGGCFAVKYYLGVPLDEPDPECVLRRGDGVKDNGKTTPT